MRKCFYKEKDCLIGQDLLAFYLKDFAYKASYAAMQFLFMLGFQSILKKHKIGDVADPVLS